MALAELPTPQSPWLAMWPAQARTTFQPPAGAGLLNVKVIARGALHCPVPDAVWVPMVTLVTLAVAAEPAKMSTVPAGDSLVMGPPAEPPQLVAVRLGSVPVGRTEKGDGAVPGDVQPEPAAIPSLSKHGLLSLRWNIDGVEVGLVVSVASKEPM